MNYTFGELNNKKQFKTYKNECAREFKIHKRPRMDFY